MKNFIKTLDRARAWESAKLTFAFVGAAGYAGMMSAAHFVMAVFSFFLLGGLWLGIYRMTVVE